MIPISLLNLYFKLELSIPGEVTPLYILGRPLCSGKVFLPTATASATAKKAEVFLPTATASATAKNITYGRPLTL